MVKIIYLWPRPPGLIRINYRLLGRSPDAIQVSWQVSPHRSRKCADILQNYFDPCGKSTTMTWALEITMVLEIFRPDYSRGIKRWHQTRWWDRRWQTRQARARWRGALQRGRACTPWVRLSAYSLSFSTNKKVTATHVSKPLHFFQSLL
jgi:hypothetical protein